MTPAGTRVTWFVLGVCVGVLLAVVGMAGIAEAASRSESQPVEAPVSSSRQVAPVTAEALSGTSHERDAAFAAREASAPARHDGGVPLTPKRPTAALAGPLISGEATWCAPTATQCQSWGNGRLLGAVHSFRWGDPEYAVRVSRGDRSVTVSVVSYCACLGRDDTIDLSTEAFSRLAPLSRGRIAVSIETKP